MRGRTGLWGRIGWKDRTVGRIGWKDRSVGEDRVRGRTGLWGRIGWKDRTVGEDRVEGQDCGGG